MKDCLAIKSLLMIFILRHDATLLVSLTLFRFAFCYNEGSMGKWLGCQAQNPEVTGSSLALTASWSYFTTDLTSSPKPRLLKANWVALPPVEARTDRKIQCTCIWLSLRTLGLYALTRNQIFSHPALPLTK